MKIERWVLINSFLLIFLNNCCFAERINISLYNDDNIQSVMILPVSSPFGITLDNSLNIISKPGDTLYLSLRNDSIDVVKVNGFHRTCNELRMIGVLDEAEFKIKPVIPVLEEREYNGDIIASFDYNRLLIVNNVPVEQYLAGVVYSEGGQGGLPEYYKTQAILCRTYFYKHRNRHIEEGFNLCDGTHCQAYKTSGSEFPIIIEAVTKTTGLIIVDQDSELITAAYHSNCGGETINSNDVWVGSYPYLKSVKDPFCQNKNNSKWTKIIPVEAWLNYLKENGYKDNGSNPVSLEFKQTERKTYYSVNDFRLPLKKIRDDWDLKSSFFELDLKNDKIIFKGKGYGHGVGLCQEGAMEMARQGKKFRQIIDFYYFNVKIKKIMNNL